MKLYYSEPKRVPYIEFGDGSRLIFATILEDKEKGFKYLTFSGKAVSKYKVNGNGKKRKKSMEISDHVSFSTDLKLTGLDKTVRGKGKPLSPARVKKLKALFKKYGDGEWITRTGIEEIAKEMK
ncbi:MAG: hypothetical protein ABXS91_10760 [Sulfurimonas sp.]